MVEKVILASPRGFCAGVVRAIDIVRIALELYGDEALYVRKEIVHNPHVVEDLRNRGVIFVDELSEARVQGMTARDAVYSALRRHFSCSGQQE